MENNKFYKQKSTSYLKKYSSIRDKLLKLGVSNRYIRKDLLTKSDDPNEIINKTTNILVIFIDLHVNAEMLKKKGSIALPFKIQ